MEHDSKSSDAAITAVSVPQNQKDECLPENVINKALKRLFFNEFNESSLFVDLKPNSFSEKKSNSSYSTEKNNYASGIGASDLTKHQMLEENVPFTDIFGDKTEQFKNRLSRINVEIDEIFFSSDIGKEMLLRDEEEFAKECMSMNDGTGISPNSWTVCTRKSVIDTSLLGENDLSEQRRYSIGEYIRKLSEPVGTFAGDVFCQKVYFGCNASTPMPYRRVFPEFSEMNDSFNYKHKTPACVPLYVIENKNIQWLKEAEERRCFNSDENSPFTLNSSNNSAGTSYGFLPQSDISTLKLDINGISLKNDEQEDSIVEQWIVQPQELTLDVNSKGCRLLLTNYTKTDLKFKTKFDSKFTNISPICGTLPAKGEIGLRIVVSGYIKNQFTYAEDDVIIACGKNEKAVNIKICRKQKPKNFPRKGRSYICF